MRGSLVLRISLLVGVLGILSPRAKAQDFVFSSFQCNPSSCENRTPFPVLQGSVTVTFQGVCTGSVVEGIQSFATAFVGAPQSCSEPFTPVARIVVSESEFLDDFGCPFLVDTVTENADVLDIFGDTVFHKESGAACDGSTTGPFAVGTRPC
jgi:hypothetical protein